MPASAKKAVIFDFDGVLVNSEIIALAELRDCLSEFGIERGWSEMVSGLPRRTFRGHSDVREPRDRLHARCAPVPRRERRRST